MVFVPGILADMAQDDRLDGCSLCLMDIDEWALNVIHQLGLRIMRDSQRDIQVEATTDQREAVSGADFVITSI